MNRFGRHKKGFFIHCIFQYSKYATQFKSKHRLFVCLYIYCISLNAGLPSANCNTYCAHNPLSLSWQLDIWFESLEVIKNSGMEKYILCKHRGIEICNFERSYDEAVYSTHLQFEYGGEGRVNPESCVFTEAVRPHRSASQTCSHTLRFQSRLLESRWPGDLKRERERLNWGAGMWIKTSFVLSRPTN